MPGNKAAKRVLMRLPMVGMWDWTGSKEEQYREHCLLYFDDHGRQVVVHNVAANMGYKVRTIEICRDDPRIRLGLLKGEQESEDVKKDEVGY